MILSASSPSLVLVAYAETLCRGVRALVVGDARSPLAAALVDRGARLVHVCDRDAVRRAEAAARSAVRNVSFGSLDDGPAALREGFFDLALVENVAREGDARATLAAVSRLLAPRGAALVVAPNPDAGGGAEAERSLDYYALYDAAKQAFAHVRMLGQVPFVGYAVVDFAAEGEPSAVLDASLMPPRGEEPDYFVALAGREPRALDEYAVIQLPSSGVLAAPDAPPPARTPEPAPRPEPAAREPSPAVSELTARIQRQEAWIAEIELRATTADERADAAETELDELREQLDNRAQTAARELRALAEERDALRVELEQARRKANDLSDQLALREGELKTLGADAGATRALLASKEAELGTLAAEADATRALLAHKEAELKAHAEDSDAARDLARLETQLAERSQEVRRLEGNLREAERTGRELVRKLTDQAALAPSPSLSARLAEAEAELVTLRWSLQMTGSQPPALG